MEEEIAAFAARIDELIAARSVSYRALQEARDRGVSPAERRGFTLTRAGGLKTAQAKLAAIFAEQHGWKQTDRPFSVKCLAIRGMHGHRCNRWPRPLLDHGDFFRENRRAAAAVGHLCDLLDNVEAWAQENGLKMTVSDFPSWYWPRACKLVIYTPASLVRSLGKGVSRTRGRALTIG